MAKVWPPVAGVTVYFRVWDVDDPFDQLHADMTDINLVDDDTSGPDNRPVGEAPRSYSANTDENGRASVTVIVSMQPGNNYRAAASCLQDALDQAGQAGADALSVKGDPETGYAPNGAWRGYKVPVVWSKMLTVWRKLHVEVDSMAAEGTTTSERKPDWDEVIVDIAEVRQTTTKFTVRGLTQPTGQLASNEIDHYEGGTLTFSVLTTPLFVLSSINVYQGGWFVAEIVTDGTLTPEEQLLVIGETGVLRDDDLLSGQLPFHYNLNQDSFIKTAYQPAYIDIAELESQFNLENEVPFDVQLTSFELQTGVGYDNSQNVWSSPNYWAALLVMAYQPESASDMDPDPWCQPGNTGPATNPHYDDGAIFGTTVEDDDNASVIFVEIQRDIGAPSLADKDYSHTIAHEIGHSAGPNTSEESDHSELGIMTAGAPTTENVFSPLTLLRFRSHSTW